MIACGFDRLLLDLLVCLVLILTAGLVVRDDLVKFRGPLLCIEVVRRLAQAVVVAVFLGREVVGTGAFAFLFDSLVTAHTRDASARLLLLDEHHIKLLPLNLDELSVRLVLGHVLLK
jgi:hypothetical protein